MHTGTVLPYSAYRQLPEDDPNRYEMLWGELHVAAAPRPRHQDILSNLLELLRPHVRARSLGKILPGIDVYRDEVNYVTPDLIYVTTAQLPLLDEEQPTRLVPPLVVEILSPSTARLDREEKRRWYAELGVHEYWLVDCDARSVEVIDLRTGGARMDDPVRSAVLPGLVVPLQRVFG